MVIMVALCAIACHVGAAGPDDEQVLVQQATMVRHDGINVLDLRQWIEDFAQKTRYAPVGKDGAICTQSEMEDFENATSAFKDLKQQLSQQYKEDVANASKTIISKHVEPLMQAAKRVEEAATLTFKPILRDTIKYAMIQIFKPAQKYDIQSVVKDLNQSKSSLTGLAEPVKGIWKEGFSAFDLLLNQTLQDLPESQSLLSGKLLRMAPPEMSIFDPAEYFVFKVLPVIAIEIFPSLAKPISMLGRFPEDPGAFHEWLTKEAMPVFKQSGEELGELKRKYELPKESIPTRLCSTCQEKYFAEIANMDEGCLAPCFGILKTCASGVNSTCMLSGRDCIKCHTKHTAALDDCTGNATHAKDLANWNLIAGMLENATTTQGLDGLLTNISHKILD